MSCGRDQWQQNAHGPNSLNYVTTRSNGQESLRSHARSSTHVDFKRLPQNEIWTKTFLWHKQFLCKKMLFKTTKKENKNSKKTKKIISCFWKGFQKNKFEKWLKNFFSLQMSNKFRKYILGGLQTRVFCVKKRSRYLVWKHKIEKNTHKKRSETKKEIEQK